MQVVSSYSAEIVRPSVSFRPTVDIYRSAAAFIMEVLETQWGLLSAVSDSQARFNLADKMVHRTKQSARLCICAFDNEFPKMPSYLRRAAVKDALGALSGYHSNYDNWIAGGRKGRAPRLTLSRHTMPCFYRDGMYCGDIDSDTCSLKLLIDGDYKFASFRLKHTDMEYLRKYWTGVRMSAPILEKKHGKWFLRFSFTETVKFEKQAPLLQRICAVDLGLNTDAVCTVMTSDGTVLARKFINFASEKDHLYHELNRLKRFQREHGSKNSGSRWSDIKRLNEELARKIGHAVADFAIGADCDVLVLEALDFKGKKHHGSKAQRLSLWRKNTIQTIAGHRCHRFGVRYSRICAWNTSRLAYDGSGQVVRDKDNHALCTFTTGKRYNCDLSASYNIGARYFIRELLKPLPEKARSLYQAKVPDTEHRTTCTYATLLKLNQVMQR